MLRVQIGPQSSLASWDWVGFELARELSRYFDVRIFGNSISRCDVLIAIKNLHPSMFNGAKVIYFPIDRYRHPQEIQADQHLLSQCAAIGCHSEVLMPYFMANGPSVFFMEHHARYSLTEPAAYKKDGFVLWIGVLENAPYLLRWLETHPLSLPIILLSNLLNPWSWKAAQMRAAQLHMHLDASYGKLNGLPIYSWSERAQRDLMMSAKAGIDIKAGKWLGDDFWQQETKPPTKGQQFVCSGIPFAINRDSYCHTYFSQRGFDLATPGDELKWLSEDYWAQTARAAAVLNPRLTLDVIGRELKSRIEAL